MSAPGPADGDAESAWRAGSAAASVRRVGRPLGGGVAAGRADIGAADRDPRARGGATDRHSRIVVVKPFAGPNSVIVIGGGGATVSAVPGDGTAAAR